MARRARVRGPQHQDPRPERRPVEDHQRWSKDIEETQGAPVYYPMIADPELKIAKLYDMLPAETAGESKGRTPADNHRALGVHRRPRQEDQAHPHLPDEHGPEFRRGAAGAGCIQLSAKHNVATPVNWKRGDDVIISGSVNDDDAKKLFPEGWRSPKPISGSQAAGLNRGTLAAALVLSGSPEGRRRGLIAEAIAEVSAAPGCTCATVASRSLSSTEN